MFSIPMSAHITDATSDTDRARNAIGPHRARTRAMLAIGAIAFVAYLFALPHPWGGRPITDNPHENVGYVLTERVLDGGGIGIPLRYYGDLPEDVAIALTPRDSSLVDGQAVPQDFAGNLGFHLLIMWIWEPLVRVVSPLLGVVGAFLLVQLFAELRARGDDAAKPSWRRPRDRTEAAVGMALFVLWLAHPAAFTNALWTLDSAMPSLVAVLGSTIFFFRYWKAGRWGDFAGLCLTLAAALTIRYPNAIWALTLGVALLVGKKLTLPRLAVGAGAAVLALGGIMAFNAATYGDPFTTGYHLTNDLVTRTVNFENTSLFRPKPIVFLGHLFWYAIAMPVILLLPLIGLGAALRKLGARPLPGATVALVAGSALYLAYHAGTPTWGWAGPAMTASFIRYTLPAMAIGLALLAGRLGSVPRKFKATVAAICAVSVGLAVLGPSGLWSRARIINDQAAALELALDETEPEALILARIEDRFLWPDRQTLTLTLTTNNAEPIRRLGRNANVWRILPEAQRFAEVVAAIRQQDIPLYLMARMRLEQFDAYVDALDAIDFELEPIDPDRFFYRVVERTG